MEVVVKLAIVEDGTIKVPNIPFELVDDDEMAAIEAALLHADSLSSAYHSINRAFTPSGLNSGRPHFAFAYCSPKLTSCSTEQSDNVLACSISSSTAIIADSDSTIGSAENFRVQTGSLSSAVNSLSSQSSEHEFRPLQPENTEAGLFENLFTGSSVSDESSSSLTLQDGSQVCQVPTSVASTDQFPVLSNSSALQTETAVRGQRSGDVKDMEDLGGLSKRASSSDSGSSAGREKATVTLLQRKSRRGLSVTDFTASEWCEKQVEFSLNRGKPEQTPAMKAGSVRHFELEKEVVTRVEVEIHTKEDTWAVRLLNFISGARQLLSEGITRELPVLGVVGGTWIVGIIDEIRLVGTENGEHPLLVDTKTRKRRSPPSEPQKRNARLQLMCYKMLWDSLVETGLPSESFFQYFRLNPCQSFCQDVKSHAANFWIDCQVQCLHDLMGQLLKEVRSQIYPRSVDTLLLRYEWQGDHSLLGEDEFQYEHKWLLDRWMWHLDFWKGDRAAAVVPENEDWKCRFCSFANLCLPAQRLSQEEMNGQGKVDEHA